jgi:hypothetical protein
MKENCPDWCTGEPGHDQDAFIRLHWGTRTTVYPNGIGEPTRVSVTALAGDRRSPEVCFHAVPQGQDRITSLGTSPETARVIASVIEVLADATPGQHQEFAVGIRSAAAAIEPEAEAS